MCSGNFDASKSVMFGFYVVCQFLLVELGHWSSTDLGLCVKLEEESLNLMS